MQNFLNRAHQTDTDSNNILNVLCIILSAYLDIFSFTYTSHKTDVHQSQLEMFIGVVYVHKCLAAHCCCRSYVMRSKYFNLSHSWYISFHCLCYMYYCVCNNNISYIRDNNMKANACLHIQVNNIMYYTNLIYLGTTCTETKLISIATISIDHTGTLYQYMLTNYI